MRASLNICAMLLHAWLVHCKLTCYSELVNDLFTNQEIYSIPSEDNEPPTGRLATIGQQVMQSASVSIVGVGRNVEARLKYFLPQIETLAGQFNRSQIIFAEGDSSDGSAAALQSWAAIDPSNRVILTAIVDGLTENIGSFVNTPLPREGRISVARNIVLQELWRRPRTDFVIVIDMDILGWSAHGMRDSFGRVGSWDVACAHGIVLHGIYRDTYALRMLGLANNHHTGGEDHALYNISAKQKRINREKFKVTSLPVM